MTTLGDFRAPPTKRAPPIVLDAGSGIGYAVDDAHAGRLYNIDRYTLSRVDLERSPTIAVGLEVVRRLFRSLRLELVRPNGEKVARHPLLTLFNDRPNPIQTASELWGQVAEELVLSGEAVVRLYRSRGGAVEMMRVWPFERVNTRLAGEQVVYEFGSSALMEAQGYDVVLNDWRRPDVLHVRMTWDQNRVCRAVSPWRGLGAEIVASTYAALYRAEYFRQGGSPRIVATIPRDKEISQRGGVDVDKMRESLKTFWRTVKAGPTTWLGGTTRALPEGVMPHDLGPQNTADPVLSGPARAVDEKIASIIGLPVILLGNLERATYSNARQQMAVVVRDAIRPRLDAFLSRIKRDLLLPAGGVSAQLEPVVDTDELVRDEASVYNKIILSRVNSGVMTPNEAREAFALPPHQGADELVGDQGLTQMPDDEDESEPTPGEPDDPESAESLEK